MAIFRIQKQKNYTVMSNYHLKDKRLSFKAKGLLSYMLSLPDDWDFSLNGLSSASKDNITAVRSTIKELQAFKYIDIKKLMPNETESGRIEYEYTVYEQPMDKKQDIGFLYLENLYVENHRLLNTNKLNTKKNTKKRNSKKSFPQRHYTPEELSHLYNNWFIGAF